MLDREKLLRAMRKRMREVRKSKPAPRSRNWTTGLGSFRRGTSMSMEYIRRYYGVPARRGARVKASGEAGTIVASKGCYLRIRFDGRPYGRVNFHPTWEMEYVGKGVSGG